MIVNKDNTYKIAIIGLGYVGLPLAVAFAQKYPVVGYDVLAERVEELQQGTDRTLELDKDDILSVTCSHNGIKGLYLSSDQAAIADCNIYIITVPTPINEFKCPDLTALLSATKTVGSCLDQGNIVIYESTVYPGCTEEDCVPILEKASGLKYNRDFYCGYSPERINPGDKVRTLTKIQKVTSGSTPEIAEKVDKLYVSIIDAGTYKASSIKVAEAAKAIENAQRDLNISFMNELSLIFDRMGIDTTDVLEAAATKWNFLQFKPGLVGGHCIGVDPYYLTHKARMLGYDPRVILSGRAVNDSMGAFIAGKVVKMMISHDVKIKLAKVLIMGITFKENCPDIRNTKVVDVYNELVEFGLQVDVYDPWADTQNVYDKYHITLLKEEPQPDYKAVIIAVAHDVFKEIDFQAFKSSGCVIFDTKSFIDRKYVDARL